MKKIFFIFILITLITTVSAETISHEGWFLNNRNIIFDSIDYRILISTDGSSLLLHSSFGTIPLDLEDCYTEDYTKFCYNKSVYENAERDYKAYLVIYRLEQEIKITRTATNKIISPGETSEFTVTLENTGDKDVFVNYKDDFPKNIKITQTKEVSKDNQLVYWEGEIKKGESKNFKYTIESLGDIDNEIKASVTFFDGFSEKTIFSDLIKLYSKPLLKFNIDTDKDEYELLEEVTLTLTLENEAENTITVDNFVINLPPDIVVNEKTSGLSKTDSGYSWDGKITENQTKQIELKFISKKSGLSYVTAYLEYTYLGNKYSVENKQHKFLMKDAGIDIFTFTDVKTEVSSNEVYRFYVKVKNKNSFTDIHDINLIIDTDLLGINKTEFNRIGVNKTEFMVNTDTTAPDIDTERVYPITFNVTYKIDDGTQFSEIIKKNFKVKPISKITLSPSLSKTSVTEKDSLTVTVKLSNPTLENINSVYVKSKIPQNILVKGLSSAYADIEPQETLEVLKFTAETDYVDSERNFPFEFIISYVLKEAEIETTKIINLTVKPNIPKLDIIKEVKTPVYRGEFFTVSYDITNNDDKPVYDLFVTHTEDSYFDLIKKGDGFIDKLDPGEKVTLSEEQLRSKLKGGFSLEASSLSFKDVLSRKFNKSTNKPSIKVDDSQIKGPAIYAVKTISKDELNAGESAIITINLTNYGVERAVGKIDSGKDDIIIPFATNKLFTQNITYSKAGTYTIPKTTFTYEYLGNTLTAYSEGITVIVKESVNKPSQPKTEPVIESNIAETTQTTVTTKEVKKEKSFFRKMLDSFISLFLYKPVKEDV